MKVDFDEKFFLMKVVLMNLYFIRELNEPHVDLD